MTRLASLPILWRGKMQALRYLELRESESPTSPEKKNYRLRLHEALPNKAAQSSDEQTRNRKNVNRSEFSQENTFQFQEGSSSVYFGEVSQFRTPLPTPSPSRILKPSPRIQHQSSLPMWVEPLGVWLTNRKKCNNYETFTRNVELLRRTSDMFLDPCPHVPRCSHERTLSALRRQKQRFRTDEELKKQERHFRIIEKVQQVREVWEQWTQKAKSAGGEHETRLNNFRKSRDGYSDPEEVIRKKREERIERERLLRLESEKMREEVLRKKRFRLPKIIVTYYEVEKRPESQLSDKKLPNLVNIPSGSQNGKENEDCDVDSQGSKGDRLEIPDRYYPDEYSEEAVLTEGRKKSETVALENETERQDITNSNPPETNVGDDMPKGVLEDKQETVSEEVLEDPYHDVVGSEHLEDTNENVLEESDVQPSEPTELDKDHVSENENTTIEKQNVLSLEQQKALEEPLVEQNNAGNKNDTENVQEKQSERKVEEKESERKVEAKENGNEEEKEIQMNYLVPPVAGEYGSDNGSIGDADDTASLMSAFVPVALGIGNDIIPNDAMRASSVLDRYHVPSQARLNNTKQGKNAGAWKPKLNDKKQYLEVDLGAITKVTQVSTQGCPTSSGIKVHKKDRCWVESYRLAFSTDGSQWQPYTENGTVKVFKGNKDNDTIVINSILNPVEARFVRFIPQSWKNSIAMRVEVYGEVVEPDLTSLTPPPPSLSTETEETLGRQEAIVEEEEEEDVKEFIVRAEEELDEQDAWEEDTVDSVVETASQIQSKVAVVSRSPSSMIDLTVQGEKQVKSPKAKRKPKKPKQDKEEENEEKKKKKKKKKIKEKKTKAPLVTSLSLLEEIEEEDGASSPEEEQQEEEKQEPQINSPSLPEIPKRPESVKRILPAPKRTFSMFPVKRESPEEPSKPLRRRAQTDDSIRNELLRQQKAEDRRQKLLAAVGKSKREVQQQSPVYDSYSPHSDLDDFLTKYCIISEGQSNYYKRIFKTFDEDKDGVLFPEDVLEALESVNSNLLSDSHISYIYRVLELCDCSLEAGADFKLFSVVAAFSQRVAVLDEFAKILIMKLDFRELDYKLQKAKRLFLCYVDETKKTISLEELMLGLTAGGLTADQRKETLKVLGKTTTLDFLDFLTYIPLFIHIHDHILQDPLGTVVYRDMLTV